MSSTSRPALRLLPPLFLAAGCASGGRAEPAPVLIDVDHHAGTMLTGALDAEVPAQDQSAAWAVDFELAYVDELPDIPGRSVMVLAKRVVTSTADASFSARAELGHGVRAAQGSFRAPEERWRTARVEALPPRATAAWRLESRSGDRHVPRPRWETVSLELSRREATPDGAQVALRFEGWVVPRHEDEGLEEEDRPSPPPEPVFQEERLLLEPLLGPSSQPLVLFFPAPRRHFPGAGLVATLSIEEDRAGPDFDAALARSRENIERARHLVRRGSSHLTTAEDFEFESQSALAALRRTRLQRPALVFLAEGTGARLVEELALSAEDATLRELIAEIEAGRVEANDPASLGWLLERTCYRWVVRKASDEEGPGIPPEVRAAFLRRTGEAGRYPDLIEDAVLESDGLAALDARLVAENLIFLEDGHPAARVRAYDWLAARGEAPDGFDPLGERDARRAALAHLEAETEAREASAGDAEEDEGS